MQGEPIFWTIAALVALGCLGLVFAPLLRGRGRAGGRARYDLQMHRDQLREVEADRARGVMSDEEAAATRIEVSRRLLVAADAAAAEGTAEAAPRHASRLAALAMMLALLAAAGGLYLRLGSPGLPDQPLAERMARAAAAHADRPDQAAAEAFAAEGAAGTAPTARPEDLALIDRLRQVLESRPDDVAGHRLLVQSLGALGRWPEARAAQERVVAILGDRATGQDLADLAEVRILAAGGYVSPEAEAALGQALARDPENPVARYYSGLTLMQAGRPDLAYRLWERLVAEGPPGAPWMAPARAGLAEAARLAGLPPPAEAPVPGPAAPGPSAADVEAAESMSPEARQAMIESMVDGLAARLADAGGPPADWARLIRALGVLGRRDEAGAILAEARAAHAGDAAGLAEIEAAAQDAGLAP